MSFQFSNPYALTPTAPRSTFAAASASPGGYQVLFSNLPPDVSEKDLRASLSISHPIQRLMPTQDLLINKPLGLAASTTSVQAFYASTGQFIGTALIHVAHEADAEKIRREYSGETIDGSYKLLVQHVLPPTQSYPSSSSVTPLTFPAASQPKPVAQPSRQLKEKPKASAPAAQVTKNKPPGLELLSRLSKPGGGTPKEKQLALLAKQKANLKAAGKPGTALLSRLAKHSPAGKAGINAKRAVSGDAKVARAKKSMAMDVDKVVKPVPAAGGVKKEKPKTKQPTQEDLDEEMRVYERARRFGAAA